MHYGGPPGGFEGAGGAEGAGLQMPGMQRNSWAMQYESVRDL